MSYSLRNPPQPSPHSDEVSSSDGSKDGDGKISTSLSSSGKKIPLCEDRSEEDLHEFELKLKTTENLGEDEKERFQFIKYVPPPELVNNAQSPQPQLFRTPFMRRWHSSMAANAHLRSIP